MHQGTARIYPTTGTRIDSILFGCVLGVWKNPYLDSSASKGPGVSPRCWMYVFLPAAVIALLCCVSSKDPRFQNTANFSVQGLALTVVFTAAIRFHDWFLFRILNHPVVVYVGTLSYSLYLAHDVLLHAAVQLWPHAHAWQRALAALRRKLRDQYVGPKGRSQEPEFAQAR